MHLPPLPKTVNLGLGVATLLDESLNGSLFHSHPHASSVECYFEVTTGPESRGIFVVLSQLSSLRRWPNGSCQDYIRIKYANFFSAAICGPVGMSDESILSFDSSSKVVGVEIHLDGSKWNHFDFQMRIKLILTAYFDCEKEKDGFSCTNTNERCIPREYVGDGLVNCDVPACRDEGSCTARNVDDLFVLDDMYRDSLSVTILIGLVSFVSTGLLFGLMLWFCLKRNFKQRLSGTASTPNLDMELSNVYGTPQAGGSGGRAINLDAPGGSNMDAGGPTPSADPPPSYDILFPDK